MTTRERREEYKSNVVRTLHPSRPLSPVSNTEFDSSLDNMLDDLQASVSRPGSALGHSGGHSNYSTTSRTITGIGPAGNNNQMMHVNRERSLSPGGIHKSNNNTSDGTSMKKAHYEYYSSSTGNAPNENMQQNIHQLDSLLNELKHEREINHDNSGLSYSGIDSEPLEPGTKRIVKSVQSYSNSGSLKPGAQRELHFDSPSNTSTRSRQKSPGYQKIFESQTMKDVSSYDPYYPDKTDNSYTVQHRAVSPIATYNETVNLDDPSVLQNLPLNGEILPGVGTKVTTTVRTYTYEIPAGSPQSPATTNQMITHKDESYNMRTELPERDVPVRGPTSPMPGGGKTVMYKKETINTTNEGMLSPYSDISSPSLVEQIMYPGSNGPNGPNGPKRPNSPAPGTKTIMYKKNTETMSNVYPPTIHYDGGYPPQPAQPNSTVIYKHDVTNTTNTNMHSPPTGGVPVYPPSPSMGQPQSPKTTYYYKHESTNTKNTRYAPPPGMGSPPPGYPDDRYPPNGYYSPNSELPHPSAQPSPVNSYSSKYTTHTTTTRNPNGGTPDERQPLMPFPTDGYEPHEIDGNPPRRLNDLLATFGDRPSGPYSDGQVSEKPYVQSKDATTAIASSKTANDPKLPSKNIAGPPVYYPPNHEIFTKREEEGGGAWRAQGGYAKGSGKYMYESESSSKSKSKSGAAVVPVCLPLCCAMPCSIM